jgi:hypothetical protein
VIDGRQVGRGAANGGLRIGSVEHDAEPGGDGVLGLHLVAPPPGFTRYPFDSAESVRVLRLRNGRLENVGRLVAPTTAWEYGRCRYGCTPWVTRPLIVGDRVYARFDVTLFEGRVTDSRLEVVRRVPLAGEPVPGAR